jgi:hypothetical protein
MHQFVYQLIQFVYQLILEEENELLQNGDDAMVMKRFSL